MLWELNIKILQRNILFGEVNQHFKYCHKANNSVLIYAKLLLGTPEISIHSLHAHRFQSLRNGKCYQREYFKQFINYLKTEQLLYLDQMHVRPTCISVVVEQNYLCFNSISCELIIGIVLLFQFLNFLILFPCMCLSLLTTTSLKFSDFQFLTYSFTMLRTYIFLTRVSLMLVTPSFFSRKLACPDFHVDKSVSYHEYSFHL